MNNATLRWGILGAAQIARKNWKAILNSGNGTIMGVASRDIERSRRFIEECQTEAPFERAPRAFGSYEELLRSSEVDAVYIPLPTGVRKEWVIRAAEAGKHVICEKPCAPSVLDLKEMIEVCRRNGVQFMDGVMFVHSQRMEAMRKVLDDGQSIGEVRRISSGFSFNAPSEFFSGNIRTHSSLEPHGCLGDLGWYCIRFALWTMGWKLPRRVIGRALSQIGRKDSPESVPTEFSGELLFDNGVSAGFYCSFITELQQWSIVSGARGNLQVSDFVLPFFGNELSFKVQNAAYVMRGCDFVMESHARDCAVSEYSNSHPNAQETHLFRNFAAQVLSGELHGAWPEYALKTQQVMNACLESALAGGPPVEID